MCKIISIIHYEYKMQIKRPATWGILLVATILTLLDNFPSVGNLARLEFLNQPAYFIYRIMSFDVLILTFGLLFLLAGRFPVDSKTGMKPLLLSVSLQKGQYIWGKLLGGLLYVLSILCIFLTVNMVIYFVAAPFEVDVVACVFPLMKTIVVSVIPVSLFVSFCSITIPAIIDIRLFYILAAVLFGFNVTNVGTAESMPFYLITSGDLIRLIWVHPEWPQIDMRSVLANGIFLIGSGLISWGLLFLKRSFWRVE